MFNPAEQNFIGRDPMQWWIGQVTDPKKGEWEASLEKRNAEDGEPIYSHRCRVRIVGYHGNEADLPDKDLPLAHVLLPPNVSTVAGESESMKYQGGEVVVGFFFDGADGQQPVIFGTLFKQSFVRDKLTSARFNAFSQTEFTPWTPPLASQMMGPHLVQTESPASKTAYQFARIDPKTGKTVKYSSVNEKVVENNTNPTWVNPTACEDNEIQKINTAINEFTRKMSASQSLGSITVDPFYGGIINKTQEIKKTSIQINNSMSKLMRRGRSWVIKDTLNNISTRLKDKTPIHLQAPVGEASKNLVDIAFCNFEKINEQLMGYLEKSLENMLGKVLDVPICAVESFLGDMFGQINNILDTQMADMFDQLNNISGGGIKAPSETFSKGMKFANLISNVVGCDSQKCPPNTAFNSANGVQSIADDAFGAVFDIAGINSLKNQAEGLLDIVDGLIPDVSSPSTPKVDCNTNVLKCGPPRVDFIGSPDGKGASGTAIVNTFGQVIGVAINEPGSGYTDPPLLTFVDGCKNGYGAAGYVRMENGSVADVVMTDGGHEYIPNTTETDLDGNVKEIIPDPNANYDGASSFVTSLSDVVIENTGVGYEEGDTVTVDGGAEVELNIVEGRIVGANVTNKGFGFTNIPDLTINSDTGVLARLSPILEFTRIDDAKQLADTNIPFNKDIPQEAVITIIDCVTK